MKTYHVQYTLFQSGEIKGVDVVACSKVDAYTKAVYEKIPSIVKCMPYSAWVSSVTYNNGNYKMFNNFEGKPY